VLLTVGKSAGQGSRFFIDLLTERRVIPPQCIAVIFDAGEDLSDDSLLLWRALNNVDPLRDISIGETTAIVDATRKGAADGHLRPWPEDVTMNGDVKKRVAERSVELGISRHV
jgi:4-hydroxy-3-polyprenylbenzoate decarboxylase